MTEIINIRTPEPNIVSLAEKVSFLRKPESYPHPVSKVETKETHMSWVFLADDYVYKLKKPVQYHFLDFRAIAARYENCETEVAINKRLANDIYVGIVPLVINENGKMAIDERGEIIDWLVKMKRISENNFLDFAIEHNKTALSNLEETAKLLADFYIHAPRVNIGPEAYRIKLREEILYSYEELCKQDFGLSKKLIKQVYDRLNNFLEGHTGIFDARVLNGKIIEAHGDLRPEHICLSPQPAIIDALEFNRDLRIMDIAEELSFLAMECEIIGNTQAGEYFISIYKKYSGDEIPRPILYFYKAKKSLLRTYLTARHLAEECYKNDPQWIRKATAYLHSADQNTNFIRGDT